VTVTGNNKGSDGSEVGPLVQDGRVDVARLAAAPRVLSCRYRLGCYDAQNYSLKTTLSYVLKYSEYTGTFTSYIHLNTFLLDKVFYQPCKFHMCIAFSVFPKV
jgi:hypothetical protein